MGNFMAAWLLRQDSAWEIFRGGGLGMILFEPNPALTSGFTDSEHCEAYTKYRRPDEKSDEVVELEKEWGAAEWGLD